MDDSSKLAALAVISPFLIIAILIFALVSPNGSEYIPWIFLLAMIVISVIFLCGKGTWAIAGFNTMGDSEKSQYDTKKLARLVGLVSLTTIPLILSAIIESEGLLIFSIILMVCASIFVIVFCNKRCML
ncbi:DUF3784 domain-containing protein [Candidatus Methanomassiliicoccus intestinalis]|uniref:DUF3784 domain-containing protein n=1 Tax=Candidatus Methanomassiliicoccus intestinalis TaxID=1406512 RepID=UPI0037DDC7CD